MVYVWKTVDPGNSLNLPQLVEGTSSARDGPTMNLLHLAGKYCPYFLNSLFLYNLKYAV